jgi:hypothetical protein
MTFLIELAEAALAHVKGDKQQDTAARGPCVDRLDEKASLPLTLLRHSRRKSRSNDALNLCLFEPANFLAFTVDSNPARFASRSLIRYRRE